MEGDQGKGQGWRPGEEEADGQVEPLGDTDITASGIVIEVRHLPVRRLLVGRVVQLREDPEPVRVKFVHPLASDFELDLLDELLGRVERGVGSVLGHRDFEEQVVQQIPIPGNGDSDALSEPDGTGERGLDRFDGERGVPLVQRLEERNGRVTRQVDIWKKTSGERVESDRVVIEGWVSRSGTIYVPWEPYATSWSRPPPDIVSLCKSL